MERCRKPKTSSNFWNKHGPTRTPSMTQLLAASSVAIPRRPRTSRSIESFLLQQQVEAVNDSLKQSAFKTKHCNVWVTAAAPFFNSEKWAHLADAPPIEEFKLASCFVGLDLASKVDLCAKVLVFEKEVAGKPHFYAYCSAYLHTPCPALPRGGNPYHPRDAAPLGRCGDRGH